MNSKVNSLSLNPLLFPLPFPSLPLSPTLAELLVAGEKFDVKKWNLKLFERKFCR